MIEKIMHITTQHETIFTHSHFLLLGT